MATSRTHYTAGVLLVGQDHAAKAEFRLDTPIPEIWAWVDAAKARAESESPEWTYEGWVIEHLAGSNDVPRPTS
jgi:hypothetical protein